jgi:hypothetical protein
MVCGVEGVVSEPFQISGCLRRIAGLCLRFFLFFVGINVMVHTACTA